jgi:hypothetical protein
MRVDLRAYASEFPILTGARFIQPAFVNIVKKLEVEESRKHRIPVASQKVANEIAMAGSTEPVKQWLAGLDLESTTFGGKPSMSGGWST